MYVTYIIIAITVLLSFNGFNKPVLIRKLILNPYRIKHDNEYYRFISSGFIHRDHVHLLWNMLSFYFFGVAVENEFLRIFDEWGVAYYIGLYLLAIIAADISTYHKHKDNPAYNALGASGGVAAVIFAFIIFKPVQDICLYFVVCLPGFILGSLYILFSYYQGRKANDGINHEAHLYGALFGLVYCIILYPASIPEFLRQVKGWRMFEL